MTLRAAVEVVMSAWKWLVVTALATLILQVPNSGAVAQTIPGSRIIGFDAGFRHVCANRFDGAIVCWGNNQFGQLGDGTNSGRAYPGRVTVASNFGRVRTNLYTIAQRTAAEIWMWGGGVGGSPRTYSVPTNIYDLAIGARHSCFILEDQTVWCKGHTQTEGNEWGQLGRGGNPGDLSVLSPVSGLRSANKVALGVYQSCAVLTDATLACWGQNNRGQLGDGTTSPRNLPVTVLRRSGASSIPLSNAVDVDTGTSHSCAVLDDGSVSCWGWNSFGQLGDGAAGDALVATGVIGVSDAIAVTVGYGHSCALRRDGKVFCWGSAGLGATSRTAVEVQGLADVAEIHAGDFFTCARLNEDAGMRCWGANESGQLGNGTTLASAQPVAVVFDADGVSDAAEDQGPNGGDANGDGVRDSLQDNVTTLRAASGSTFLSVSTDCSALVDVQTRSEEQLAAADSTRDYPYGLVQFTIPCSTATVQLRVFGSAALEPTYRKYGPTTPGDPSTVAWYDLEGATYSQVQVGNAAATLITFTLHDGFLGDDTAVDGRIVDIGGPASSAPAAVPASGGPSLAALALLLAAALFASVPRSRNSSR